MTYRRFARSRSRLGASANPKRLVPEAVLEIRGIRDLPEREVLSSTLGRSRGEKERIVTTFLQVAQPVVFPNTISRVGMWSCGRRPR